MAVTANAVPSEEMMTMTKLTDTQRIVLSAAAARADGAAVVPAKLNRIAVAKVGTSLIRRKFMRQARSKAAMPVWRIDREGRSTSLVLTRAGRDAITAQEVANAVATTTMRRGLNEHVKARNSRRGAKGISVAAPVNVVEAASNAFIPASPRPGTKQSMVVAMLSKAEGATLDALVKATGWLPHTTRAALTGLRKKGFGIERRRAGDGQSSLYYIVMDGKIAA
jgi:hypothetical protein